MSRPKTISNDDLLAIARKVFRAEGHVASTRQIAEAAGVSEGVLYQRFASKDLLFFAAMAPRPPDIDRVLGAEDASESPRDYCRDVVLRMAEYFGEVLPLALALMTHPSFDPRSLSAAQESQARLQAGLTRRLSRFEHDGQLRASIAPTLSRLLVSVAHDWALGMAMSEGPRRSKELHAMIDLVWEGARPTTPRQRG